MSSFIIFSVKEASFKTIKTGLNCRQITWLDLLVGIDHVVWYLISPKGFPATEVSHGQGLHVHPENRFCIHLWGFGVRS